MASFTNKVIACLPQIPSEANSAIATSPRILAANAQYIFPVLGVFPNCYEFVITYTGFPPVTVSGKDYNPRSNSVLPINPGQPHQARHGGFSCPLYNPFFIDKNLVNSISVSLGGSDQVEFSNDVSDLHPDLKKLAGIFMLEALSNFSAKMLALSSLEIMIVVNLLRHLPNNHKLSTKKLALVDKQSIKTVVEYMRHNFKREISLEELAGIANYSSYHFIRVFKQQTGKTPFDYLIDIKLEKATELLRDKKHTVTQICYECGFSNPSHFTTVFKRRIGVTPSHFQKFS